jgi:hypothetical protein
MNASDCRSELLVSARRGQLSEQGRVLLDAHLAVCAPCRLSRDVSGDFDDADAIDLHDGARIRALGDLARRQVWGRGRAPARLRAVAVAAALVIFGGTASAAVWWWRRPPGSDRGGAAASTIVAPPVGAGARAKGTIAATAPTVTPASPMVAPAPPVARPRPARPAARTVALAHPAEAETPGAILRLATEARQKGDRGRAAELYRRLQREFSASPEAVLSSIPLGGLLLDDGLPRAALAEFDRYLAAAHGGALIPEALYGRARALAQLGDRVRERETWSRLCADFPDSAYAPLGRRRLAEIE